MIKNYVALPKSAFVSMLDYFKDGKDIILISKSIGYNYDFLKGLEDRSLQLRFDDIDYESDGENGVTSIKDHQVESIVRFLNKYQEEPDNYYLFVHCHAGVSRSGAVVKFIQDVYQNKTYEEFIITNPNIYPNEFILRKLHEKYQEIYLRKV